MISTKDLLLADVAHAERLHWAEQARLVHEAVITGQPVAPGRRRWSWAWRPGRRPHPAPVPELSPTRA